MGFFDKGKDRPSKQQLCVDGETRTRTAVHVCMYVCACMSPPRAAVARRNHRMQAEIDREAPRAKTWKPSNRNMHERQTKKNTLKKRKQVANQTDDLNKKVQKRLASRNFLEEYYKARRRGRVRTVSRLGTRTLSVLGGHDIYR